MTREDIIRMAEEAGLAKFVHRDGHKSESMYVVGHDFVAKFAQLVAAHEREECAKLCEKITDGTTVALVGHGFAEEIRART